MSCPELLGPLHTFLKVPRVPCQSLRARFKVYIPCYICSCLAQLNCSHEAASLPKTQPGEWTLKVRSTKIFGHTIAANVGRVRAEVPSEFIYDALEVYLCNATLLD